MGERWQVAWDVFVRICDASGLSGGYGVKLYFQYMPLSPACRLMDKQMGVSGEWQGLNAPCATLSHTFSLVLQRLLLF